MKSLAFMAAVFLGAGFAAYPAAAQSPAIKAEAVRGVGTNVPDRVGPNLVGGNAARPLAPQAAGGKVAVTTYHYDVLRSGWNNRETTLTAANISQSTFGIVAVTGGLDDQIDAQPLLVPNVTLTIGPYAGTTHDVVYVVTESNSIYAIDAATGAILLSTNLGPPVTSKSINCPNGGPNVGILSTPVIDLAAQTIYAMAYVSTGPSTPPIYQLHGLNISDLTHHTWLNGGQPITVAATHVLSDGSTYSFNAAVQRQRPALLEANGNIYAGFGSHCDNSAAQSRGWVLGWNAYTLQPLAANQLNDTLAPPQPPPPQAPINWYLSSVWMSGFGISASGSRIYFATGNSDCNFGNPAGNPVVCPNSSTFDGVHNIQESAVRMEGDLTKIDGVWSPNNRAVLDKFDGDLGSGGLLLINSPNPALPLMAAVAGKDGNLFLLARQNSGALTLLDSHRLDECWCGPSYFVGSDGVDRIVTSQGATLQTWQIQSPAAPHLVAEGAATIPSSEQDGGFFTTVSSNGTTAGSAIIWAVGRPTGVSYNPIGVTLYAFDARPTGSPATYNQIYSLGAGAWPNTFGNANIVPVVANGYVYVANAYNDPQGKTCPAGKTCGLLVIYGLGGHPFSTVRQAWEGSQVAPLDSPRVLSGTLIEANGTTLTLKTRAGKSAKVDASQVINGHKVGVPLNPGVVLTVQGSALSSTGELEATGIVRAKGRSGKLWPPDLPGE
jgi:hypothetical protein